MPARSPILTDVAQLELSVDDLEKARVYYGEVLGIELESMFGKSLLLRCGSLRLLIQESAERRIGCPIYFQVDGRVHEVAARLKENGVRFKSGPTCIVEEFMGKSSWLAFFEDPWGNPLALSGDMPVGQQV